MWGGTPATLKIPYYASQTGFQNNENNKIKLMIEFVADISLKWSNKVHFFLLFIIDNYARDKSTKTTKIRFNK